MPLCYINETIIKIANDWLAARPVNALAEFVLWGLNDIVSDMQPHQSPQKGSKGAVAPSSKTKASNVFCVTFDDFFRTFNIYTSHFIA